MLQNRPFFLVFSIIVVTLIVDTAIVKVYRFTFDQPSLAANLIIFLVMVAIYFVGQFLTITFVRSKMKLFSSNFIHGLKLILNIVFMAQCVPSAIILIVLYQVVQTSSYDPLLLKAIIWSSYLQAILLTGFLSYKFITWTWTGKSYVVLLYTLAISLLSINAIFTLLYVNELLLSYSMDIRPRGNTFTPYANPNSLLIHGFQVSSIASYLTMWAATVVLLYNHAKRLGRIRFWFLVCIPFVYFIVQFQPMLLQMLYNYRLSDPVLFSLIYTIFFAPSKPIGGILFGIAFFSTSKMITSAKIKDFLVIAGFGLTLFFTANQGIVLSFTPYPPFGLVTVGFMGVTACLLLIGVYCTAISLAEDVTLRKNIRKSLKDQSLLLDKIGISQMEQQIQKNVLNLTKGLSAQLEDESGIQPSLEEEDVKKYVGEVLTEITELKKKNI